MNSSYNETCQFYMRLFLYSFLWIFILACPAVFWEVGKSPYPLVWKHTTTDLTFCVYSLYWSDLLKQLLSPQSSAEYLHVDLCSSRITSQSITCVLLHAMCIVFIWGRTWTFIYWSSFMANLVKWKQAQHKDKTFCRPVYKWWISPLVSVVYYLFIRNT